MGAGGTTDTYSKGYIRENLGEKKLKTLRRMDQLDDQTSIKTIPSCGGFLLLGSSSEGEATGTLSVSWPVGGVWNEEGAACHTNDRSQQILGQVNTRT